MTDISAQDTVIYSEVFGPSIEEEISPGESTSYSDDTYGDLVSSDSGFAWGWIVFIIFFISCTVGLFFWLKSKLLRKDSNEKVRDTVTFEVKVPRINEVEIGVAEQMFANLVGIGGKGKGLAKFFSVQNSISFEIVGLPGEIRFFCQLSKKIFRFSRKTDIGILSGC